MVLLTEHTCMLRRRDTRRTAAACAADREVPSFLAYALSAEGCARSLEDTRRHRIAKPTNILSSCTCVTL